jgi:periplasmic protein TonB
MNPEPNPPSDPADKLFRDSLVVSDPHFSGRAQLGLRTSLIAHTLVLAAVILIPIYWPEALPEQPDLMVRLIFNPPPPPPPPPLKGSSIAPKVEQTKPVTPDPHPETPKFTEPETPKDEAKVQPEEKVSANEVYGSENGSATGDAAGIEGGVEGGVVGGVLGGVLGGCVGCTGDGPVMDYDQAPRPIKITRPRYPQDAFIKKVEGKVVVEILIDATGKVIRARVIQSVPLLDKAAIETVYQWIFSPAVKRGRPVATLALAPVDFRIF